VRAFSIKVASKRASMGVSCLKVIASWDNAR
jgi:hypothetical protein